MGTAHPIARLLHETKEAHRGYELDVLDGGYDEQWPEWYASYLLEHGLADHLGRPVRPEEVTAWLRASDEAHQREAPEVEWTEFYASRPLR